MKHAVHRVMLTLPMSSKPIKSSRPKKSKAKRSGRCKNATKTKVVVRRLPPLLPENLFMESVKQWVNEETVDWCRFHQGRISKSKNKENIFSRAYFHFRSVEQVLEFHRGNENKAVVEFAVYQKLPKDHKKSDPRQGTIENDPDYLAFLESLKVDENRQAILKEPGTGLEGGATQLERLEARLTSAIATAASNVIEKPKSTPLLDHLRAQKSGAKSKSPPPKQSQMTVLSPPSSPAKNSGSKTKQIQQIRGMQVSEATFLPSETTKDIEKVREKEMEAIDARDQEKSNEKSKDRSKEKESYRERDREKIRERRKERERQRLKEKQKAQVGAAKSETPVVTILTKPQVEEDIKADAKDKDVKRSAPVKITIQQRQKDQIRQIIKESVKEPSVAESSIETSPPTTTTSTASSTSITSETKEHSFNRRRERDRSRKPSVDSKQPVQIQILTKSQSQVTSEEDVAITNTPLSADTTDTSNLDNQQHTPNSNSQHGGMPPLRQRGGRGYFGKRARW
ncbi:6367_t:CDS:2 [Dentiscutata heterogama]|uniref:6367_t:CDS:1 n=1 Tax=Dentiscutata heterogama TaxID=1316150 RepID=A0ACA9LIQ8_9GLOM|nr:6367_t:CDS:2 [Dentiscutata heterogama]